MGASGVRDRRRSVCVATYVAARGIDRRDSRSGCRCRTPARRTCSHRSGRAGRAGVLPCCWTANRLPRAEHLAIQRRGRGRLAPLSTRPRSTSATAKHLAERPSTPPRGGARGDRSGSAAAPRRRREAAVLGLHAAGDLPALGFDVDLRHARPRCPAESANGVWFRVQHLRLARRTRTRAGFCRCSAAGRLTRTHGPIEVLTGYTGAEIRGRVRASAQASRSGVATRSPPDQLPGNH